MLSKEDKLLYQGYEAALKRLTQLPESLVPEIYRLRAVEWVLQRHEEVDYAK